MNELARLGVAMDTNQLKEGKAALDALVPSAAKAEKGIDRFNAAAAGMAGSTGTASAGMKNFTYTAMGADKALSALRAAAAGTTPRVHLLGNGVDFLTGKVNSNFVAMNKAISSWNSAKASLSGIPAAANGAASSLNRLGAAANDNINQLQSTPGNIAAQFQDIGVTAAGGMNPLLIALQQGTQLSAAMQGGVGNLIAGLRQLFNMTTILTVGFVALIAAGLQMVDWMRVAEVLVNGLADGLDGLAGFIEQSSTALVYFSGVALLAFGPRILASVVALSTSILQGLVTAVSTATLAMISFSLANPFGALLIAIGLVITAMVLLNDTFGGIFTGILKTVKYVANAIIRGFLTAFNAVLTAGETLVNGLIAGFNKVSGFFGFEAIGNVDLSGMRADLSAGRDFVGDIGAGIANAARGAASFARGLLPSGETPTAPGAGGAGGAASRVDREAQAYDQLILRAQERIGTLTDETMALGMTEAAAARFLAQQELLRDATSRGITLDKARRDELMALGSAMASAQIDLEVAKATRAYQEQLTALQQQSELIGLTGFALEHAAIRQELMNEATQTGALEQAKLNGTLAEYLSLLDSRAATLASQSEDNRNAEFTADFTRNLELQTAAMERSRGEIGLIGPALTAYRIESELLNRAARENIELTPEYIESIRQQAARFGELTEQVRLQQERFDDARESLRGFFGDMVSGLQQGQSVWEVFGNAVMNVVNRIINRLLDMGTDSLLGSLGGLFGVISGSEVARLTGSASATISANPQLFAKGGAFTDGVQMFAKGGAFTNGIYNNPTLFKFAKGGAFGMMGEAGPEAVMPLKRGSDGSLGVRVTAMEPQQVVVRVITDDERFDAYVDTRIGQSAPQVAQAGALISERENAFKQTRRLA